MNAAPVDPTDVVQGLTVEAHSHRWRLDEQAGARSEGHCSCGQEKSFVNGWDGDGFQLGSGNWHNRGIRAAASAK